MVIYRLQPLNFSLAAGSHILSPDAAAELHDATSVLEAAEREAARLRQQAEIAFDIEKARGHAEGRREAEEQAAARLVQETSLLERKLQAIEIELVDIVVGCVRQILRDYGDMDLAQSLIRNALQRMRSERTVRLRVPPTRLEEVRANTDQLLQEFSEIELIDVVADETLEPPRMAVESTLGRIDLDVDQGLERLRTILLNAISGMKTDV